MWSLTPLDIAKDFFGHGLTRIVESIVEMGAYLAGEGAIYWMKAFGIVPRFVGKTLSGKKAFFVAWSV
jgi:hypothetical protein